MVPSSPYVLTLIVTFSVPVARDTDGPVFVIAAFAVGIVIPPITKTIANISAVAFLSHCLPITIISRFYFSQRSGGIQIKRLRLREVLQKKITNFCFCLNRQFSVTMSCPRRDAGTNSKSLRIPRTSPYTDDYCSPSVYRYSVNFTNISLHKSTYNFASEKGGCRNTPLPMQYLSSVIDYISIVISFSARKMSSRMRIPSIFAPLTVTLLTPCSEPFGLLTVTLRTLPRKTLRIV